MIYRVYLRGHDGLIDMASRLVTKDATAAEAAYRALLSRDELLGHPVSAVLSSTVDRPGGSGHAIYLSRFDRDVGGGRIDPRAPLSLTRESDGTAEATAWRSEGWVARDWESDPRPLGQCLRDWHNTHGWGRDRAAAEVRLPVSTYNGLCAGRSTSLEPILRRLMTLIDATM